MSWIIVLLVVAVVVVVIAAAATPRMRSASLRRRFGPEYDRLVAEEGDRRQAEAELRERTRRREALEVHDLEPGSLTAYRDQWRTVQEHFVDEPEQTVGQADALVEEVMRERGYPVDEFDERLEMVSVDHPELAENYRVAHAIHISSTQQTAVSLDELREAFQRYRALFTELLANGTPTTREDADGTDVREEDTP